MKCMYYVSPTLTSAHHISDDLHEIGIGDWFLHVVSKDESGLSKEKLHSSNYIETLDFIRDGLIGAAMGFSVALVVATFLNITEAFGQPVPILGYIGIVGVITCFGAWVGGLTGIASENKKLSMFHDEIEKGNHLFLIYAKQDQEDNIQAMMKKKHTEAELVAIDPHYLNPFAALKHV